MPTFSRWKKGDLLALPRFAEKSVDNLLAAIASARETSFFAGACPSGLSIPQVGEETALRFAGHFGKLEKFSCGVIRAAGKNKRRRAVIAQSIVDFFGDKQNQKILENLLSQIKVELTEALPR